MMDREMEIAGVEDAREVDAAPEVEDIAADLGLDLAGVTLHAGSEKAAAHGARAFADGDEVHFGEGELEPGTAQGRALIAHELAHVVQAREQGPAAESREESEREADAAARGERVQLSAISSPTPHFQGGGKQGPTLRRRMIEATVTAQTTLTDVQGIPEGKARGNRVATAMVTLSAEVGRLVQEMAKLGDAEKMALGPVVANLLAVASRLAELEPAQRPIYLQLAVDLRLIFGNAVTPLAAAEGPRGAEQLALASEEIAAAAKELAAELAKFPMDRPAITGPIGLEPLAVAVGLVTTLPLKDKKSLHPAVEALTAQAMGIESYVKTPPVKLLRARVNELRQGVALPHAEGDVHDMVKAEHQVEAMANRRDFDAIVDRIRTQLEKVYQQRTIAVGTVEKQSEKTDPEVHSIWEDLAILALTTAGGVLLQKALAFVSGKVADVMGGKVDEIKDAAAGRARLARGVNDAAAEGALKEGQQWIDKRAALEKFLNDKGGVGIGKAKEAAGKALHGEGSPDVQQKAVQGAKHMAVDSKIAFFMAQRLYLSDKATEYKNATTDNINKELGAQLEQVPRSTLDSVKEIEGGVTHVADGAMAEQQRETLVNYIALQARASHGDVRGNMDKRFEKKVELEGWMHNNEGAYTVKPNYWDQFDKRKGIDMRESVEMQEAHGVGVFDHKANAVISIELERNPKFSEPVRIAKAWATGLNEEMRTMLERLPLNEIKTVPVRVEGSFYAGVASFARNELGEMWTHFENQRAFTWCLQKVVHNGGSSEGDVVEKAAKLILEKDLGDKRILDHAQKLGG